MNTECLTKLLSSFVSQPPKDRAYAYGYDAGLNGASEVNCHFSIFSSKENTKEWERGKADGEKARLSPRKKNTKGHSV